MFSQWKKMEEDVLIFNTFTLHANAYFICFELDELEIGKATGWWECSEFANYLQQQQQNL